MYSRFRFILARTFSESYYDKLITNIAKEMYFNGKKFLVEIDPDLDIDTTLVIDIDKKMVELAYPEVSKGIYSNVAFQQYNEYLNKTLINKLIEDEKYDILNDILSKTTLFLTPYKNPKVDNSINNISTKLEDRLFPISKFLYHNEFDYDGKYKISNNHKELNLLEKIISANKDYETLIKEKYIYKAINTISTTSFAQLRVYLESLKNNEEEFNVNNKSIEIYKNNLDFVFKDNTIITKQDLINNLDKIIENYRDSKNHSKLNKKNLILSILEYCELSKFEQYKILTKNFNKNDYIFIKFLNDVNEKEMFFEEITCLICNNSKNIELNLFYEENDVKLINELIGDIRTENNVSNKEIMITKLKEKFKIDNDSISLENINNVILSNEKNIKELSKDEFESLYSISQENKIKEFEEKLNSFENR